MKKLRVLVLVHDVLVPPPNAEELDPEDTWAYQMELDVQSTLTALGHEVKVFGVEGDLNPVKTMIGSFKPDIVFNIITDFHDVITYEAHFVSYLELLKQPYTGCNPRGMVLAGDKGLSKKILRHEGVPVPDFAVFPRRTRATRLPAGMKYPVIVKAATKHGSAGISQASIVRTDKQLQRRVQFMHRTQKDDVVVEEFVEGRELTVSIVGNERLTVFPVWEVWYSKLPKGSKAIAEARVKWDVEYAQGIGYKTGEARKLDPKKVKRIQDIARRAYRALDLSGYARVDLRMSEAGEVFVIEVNTNADLTAIEDFAEAAEAVGHDYGDLLEMIIQAGLSYEPAWKRVRR
ncbi:MAG: ATP-grasp domain-containing protein [Planctomycetes bacterium]|nr:ATP-grasp domain-containing protein [Planctomycetota bacterium]